MPTCIPLAISEAEKAMHEFCQQWLSGLQPCLSLETAPSGEIRVCSRVIAGDAASLQPRDVHHADAGKAQKRHRGPSYHRRLQRRAAARKAAAACKLADKAIQVVSDVSTLPLIEHQPPQPLTFPIPRDELCPDKDYVLPAHDQDVRHQHHLVDTDTIPQLDGHGEAEEQHRHEDHGTCEADEWINPNPVTGLWVCRCCEYAHSFPTEDDLKLHHDKLIFEYDECNICYPWHVWS